MKSADEAGVNPGLIRRVIELSLSKTIVISLIGSAALALSAQIAIPLPWSPVPVTLQTAIVMLLPMLFGLRIGVLSVGFYLLEGLIGLPVFAGGTFGFARLLGPTGGYLVGFLLSAIGVGWLADRVALQRHSRIIMLLVLAHILLFVPGLFWLSRFVGGWEKAFMVGFVPFIAGDILKTAVVYFTVLQCKRRKK